MSTPRSATVSVTSLAGDELDLRWLHSIRIPRGVTLEVLELGDRCNLIVSQDALQVSVTVDLRTGDRLMPIDPPADPAPLDLALAALACRLAQEQDSAMPVTESSYRSPLLDIAAVASDVTLVPRSGRSAS